MRVATNPFSYYFILIMSPLDFWCMQTFSFPFKEPCDDDANDGTNQNERYAEVNRVPIPRDIQIVEREPCQNDGGADDEHHQATLDPLLE